MKASAYPGIPGDTKQMNPQKGEWKHMFALSILAFFAVFLLLMGIFAWKGLAPFGGRTLAINDGDLQYLDFFSYYKNVLNGTNKIGYTFSKMLGGSGVAVFSYYLSSPFALLVKFFPQSEMNTFFNLTAALKMATAALTMYLFLSLRFASVGSRSMHSNSSDSDTAADLTFRNGSCRQYDNRRALLFVLLAMGYALSQYSVTQTGNIIWLDGVYMLPLMLLGVYFVAQGKSIYLLAIATGCSILFNWYTGGINCLFSGVWMFMELFLQTGNGFSVSAKRFFKYVGTMLLGVMLSAFLFCPTVQALKKGNRGSLNLELLFNLKLLGNPLSTLRQYLPGERSYEGSVSLYVGMLALLGIVLFFGVRSISKRKKIVIACFGILILSFFYWNPFFLAFSLFKSATSYWCRYSYIGCFFVSAMAGGAFAHYFSEVWAGAAFENSFADVSTDPKTGRRGVFLGIGLAAVLPWVNLRHFGLRMLASICLVIIFGGLIYLMARNSDQRMHKLASALLVFCVVAELCASIVFTLPFTTMDSVNAYRAYVKENRAQLDALRQYDDGNYRISNLHPRGRKGIHTTAVYDESLAYDYKSLTSYTSSPEDIQREFLARLGYRKLGENISIVNTSILPADSLLGAKYILSSYSILGLKPLEHLPMAGDRKIYKNPYALPMILKYRPNHVGTGDKSAGTSTEGATNPFEYQNTLFEQLLGTKEELFIPLNKDMSDPAEARIALPKGNYSFYAMLPEEKGFCGRLEMDQSCNYEIGNWLSEHVVYLPVEEGRNELRLRLYWGNGKPEQAQLSDLQVYALDLGKLQTATETLKKGALSDEMLQNGIQNGKVELEVSAEQGEVLYTSIPYDSDWTIKNNGNEVKADRFADALISIPLVEGENHIKMVYHPAGIRTGCLMTGGGIVILLIIAGIRRKKRKASITFTEQDEYDG